VGLCHHGMARPRIAVG